MKDQYTLRIYDARLAKRLDNVFESTKDVYSTKNPFMVDCINRGLEAIERDLSGQKKIESLTDIYDEIHLTVDKLNTLIKMCEKNAKENIANLTVNQKLLSSNYNMLLGLTENAPKRVDYVEAGMYDDLPDRLGDLLEEVLKVYLKQ